jgi:multidrug efflux pump subunit AcrA (membrane-fusion protein)
VLAIRDGRTQRVDVKLGAQNDTQAVVTHGLHAGDLIAADKDPSVTAGIAVKPAPSATPD